VTSTVTGLVPYGDPIAMILAEFVAGVYAMSVTRAGQAEKVKSLAVRVTSASAYPS
jgi:hypothetical protein